MVEYRNVKRPAQLKPRIATDDEVERLKAGPFVCQGTGLTAEQGVTQFDCYCFEGETLAVPHNSPPDVKAWVFAGSISTADCIAWYKASLPSDATTEGTE